MDEERLFFERPLFHFVRKDFFEVSKALYEGFSPFLDPPFHPPYNAKNLTVKILMLFLLGVSLS